MEVEVFATVEEAMERMEEARKAMGRANRLVSGLRHAAADCFSPGSTRAGGRGCRCGVRQVARLPSEALAKEGRAAQMWW